MTARGGKTDSGAGVKRGNMGIRFDVPRVTTWVSPLRSTGTSRLFVTPVNPLECKGHYVYSAASNNMKLVHWPLMGGLLHLVQRRGDWAGPQPAQASSRCNKCNNPPINGQCTNFILFVVALLLPLH